MDWKEKGQATPHTAAARPYRVLDARTLGRPVHLTDRFTSQIRGEIAEIFRIRMNRRYRAGFEIGDVALAHADLRPAQRWLHYKGSAGCIGFAISRELVLCVLRYRYGAHEDEALDLETASEERLAVMLGAQFVSVVARRIESLLPEGEPSPDVQPIEAPVNFSSQGRWTLRVDVSESTRNASGSLWFLLDEAWVARLLQGLTPVRERTRAQRGPNVATAKPLPMRLQVTLTARLLEKELPLGTLLDLRVGDVIPVSMPRTDVLIGDSQLFTASVAEHKGKLCLTSFEDME